MYLSSFHLPPLRLLFTFCFFLIETVALIKYYFHFLKLFAEETHFLLKKSLEFICESLFLRLKWTVIVEIFGKNFKQPKKNLKIPCFHFVAKKTLNFIFSASFELSFESSLNYKKRKPNWLKGLKFNRPVKRENAFFFL